jgi:hypothetical protein
LKRHCPSKCHTTKQVEAAAVVGRPGTGNKPANAANAALTISSFFLKLDVGRATARPWDRSGDLERLDLIEEFLVAVTPSSIVRLAYLRYSWKQEASPDGAF